MELQQLMLPCVVEELGILAENRATQMSEQSVAQEKSLCAGNEQFHTPKQISDKIIKNEKKKFFVVISV